MATSTTSSEPTSQPVLAAAPTLFRDPLDPGVLDLQDAAELRLLLRGESVVDWHRMALDSVEQARRLFALNAFDLDDPADRERLDALRDEAIRYITRTLGLRLEAAVREAPVLELPLLASGLDGSGAAVRPIVQRNACTLLKVMHIIHHLDARELSTALAIPSNDLFAQVEASVLQIYDVLREAKVPVAEFAWSRKAKDSLVTKLLVKRQTSAARIFDRLRFRLVVDTHADIVPALHVMLRRCLPFNYVLPGETVNTLVPPEELAERGVAEGASPVALADDAAPTTPEPANEFSASSYRVLNFVADLPVRIDRLLSEEDRSALPADCGRVVFVLAEFQVLDRQTAQRNEEGETSHEQYKLRQHQRVRERLLREPKDTASGD